MASGKFSIRWSAKSADVRTMQHATVRQEKGEWLLTSPHVFFIFLGRKILIIIEENSWKSRSAALET